MNPIFSLILQSLVPFLVKEAAALFPAKPGSDKHAWVQGMVQNIVDALDRFIPPFLKPAEAEITILITNLIEAELDKLDPAKP